MKHALLAGALTLLPLGSVALAGPSLYVNSFKVRTTQEECLADTRKILEKAGFLPADIRQSTYMKKDKEVQDGWKAEHSETSMTAAFECDARNGSGAFAISGDNDNAVYKMYSELWDLLFK